MYWDDPGVPPEKLPQQGTITNLSQTFFTVAVVAGPTNSPMFGKILGGISWGQDITYNPTTGYKKEIWVAGQPIQPITSKTDGTSADNKHIIKAKDITPGMPSTSTITANNVLAILQTEQSVNRNLRSMLHY